MEDFTLTTELEMLANGDTITHHVLRPTFTVGVAGAFWRKYTLSRVVNLR